MARLIKVSVALDFHWHSTPRATLGARGQVTNGEGRMGGKRVDGQRGGVAVGTGVGRHGSIAKRVAFRKTYRGKKGYILECKSTDANMHTATGLFYISPGRVCPSEWLPLKYSTLYGMRGKLKVSTNGVNVKAKGRRRNVTTLTASPKSYQAASQANRILTGQYQARTRDF